MKHLIDFPAVPLAQLPTPLHRLDNLSRELGKNLYIKRDHPSITDRRDQ